MTGSTRGPKGPNRAARRRRIRAGEDSRGGVYVSKTAARHQARARRRAARVRANGGARCRERVMAAAGPSIERWKPRIPHTQVGRESALSLED